MSDDLHMQNWLGLTLGEASLSLRSGDEKDMSQLLPHAQHCARCWTAGEGLDNSGNLALEAPRWPFSDWTQQDGMARKLQSKS